MQGLTFSAAESLGRVAVAGAREGASAVEEGGMKTDSSEVFRAVPGWFATCAAGTLANLYGALRPKDIVQLILLSAQRILTLSA